MTEMWNVCVGKLRKQVEATERQRTCELQWQGLRGEEIQGFVFALMIFDLALFSFSVLLFLPFKWEWLLRPLYVYLTFFWILIGARY